MRTSTVLSVLLAGGALANPVRKHLEERAIVIEHKTVTTVVWVTDGEPTPAPVAAPAAVINNNNDNRKAAVVQNYNPFRHGNTHSGDWAAAQKAAQQKAAKQAAADQKAAEQKAAERKAAEQKAAEQKAAEQQAAAQQAAQQPAPVAEKAPEPKAPEQAAPEQKPQTPSQPKTAGASGETGTEGYKSAVLEHHNIHRANHSAADLEWDATLAEYAAQVAKSCVYDHDRAPGGGGYGQNIAAGTPAKQVASILTNAFYNAELPLYPGFGSDNPDNPDMGNFHAWGHFSQMVWGNTQKVGCYSHNCNPSGQISLDCNPATGSSYLAKTGCGTKGDGMYPVFTVCNYSPPGNFAGQYSQVKAPKGNPMVSV
ncbi:MAG: hypothetical protein Q9209_001312 [Squamulea sp. 1 TL-2023]